MLGVLSFLYFCMFGLCLITRNAWQFKRNISIEHRTQWVIRNWERVIFSILDSFFVYSSFHSTVFIGICCWNGTTMNNAHQSWFSHHFIFTLYYSTGFIQNGERTITKKKNNCLNNRQNGSQLKVQQMNFPNKWSRPNCFSLFESDTSSQLDTHTYIYTFIRDRAQKCSKMEQTTNK